MDFQSFNIKKIQDINIININNQEIKVLKYLPISDKNDLISIALQKAETETGVYNDILLDMYFHLNIIYLYTDINFSDEDKKDEFALYDILETNEIINKVIAAIGEQEYQSLKDYLEQIKWHNNKFKMSAAGIIRTLSEDLPKNAIAAQEIINNFKPEQYQAVTQFAKAANGDRDIEPEIETINE